MPRGVFRDDFARDLRPFVLGDHPLHLQQQVFFRSVADVPVEKDKFDAAPPQLIHQQNLICVLAGQTIGRMHVQAVDPAGLGQIRQGFEGRTNQRRAAVAFINEANLLQGKAVLPTL